MTGSVFPASAISSVVSLLRVDTKVPSQWFIKPTTVLGKCSGGQVLTMHVCRREFQSPEHM